MIWRRVYAEAFEPIVIQYIPSAPGRRSGLRGYSLQTKVAVDGLAREDEAIQQPMRSTVVVIVVGSDRRDQAGLWGREQQFWEKAAGCPAWAWVQSLPSWRCWSAGVSFGTSGGAWRFRVCSR